MNTKPREDLENDIRKSYKLYKDYEETSKYSGDPKEKARAQQGIDEQTENVKKEFERYFRFIKDTATKIPNDIREIANYFDINLPSNQVLRNDESAEKSRSTLDAQTKPAPSAFKLSNKRQSRLKFPVPSPQEPGQKREIKQNQISEAAINNPETIEPERSKQNNRLRTIEKIIVPIAVAFIGLAGVIFAAIANPDLIETIRPIKASPTPVPYARIQSLDIIESEEVINTVYPNDEYHVLAPSKNLRIKLNVNTNTDFKDLIFIWEFCHPGKNLIGQGAAEIPYTLSAREADCITVTIMKGGERLNTANFFISGE